MLIIKRLEVANPIPCCFSLWWCRNKVLGFGLSPWRWEINPHPRNGTVSVFLFLTGILYWLGPMTKHHIKKLLFKGADETPCSWQFFFCRFVWTCMLACVNTTHLDNNVLCSQRRKWQKEARRQRTYLMSFFIFWIGSVFRNHYGIFSSKLL